MHLICHINSKTSRIWDTWWNSGHTFELINIGNNKFDFRVVKEIYFDVTFIVLLVLDTS